MLEVMPWMALVLRRSMAAILLPAVRENKINTGIKGRSIAERLRSLFILFHNLTTQNCE